MIAKIEFEQALVEERDYGVVAQQQGFEEIRTQIVSLGPPIPSQLLLGTLRDGRLRVCLPITVRVTKEDKHIIAEAVDFNEFGFGENLSEALSDLQRAIVELYLTLEQEQNRLGQELKKVWDSLNQKVLRKP